MSQVDDDIVSNPSDNPRLSDVLDAAVRRRMILVGGVAAAAAAFLNTGGALRAEAATPTAAQGLRRPLLGFTAIATSTADTVVVPPGYTARVLISWGDPLSNGPAFRPDASNTVADQEQQWGMHNDGVHGRAGLVRRIQHPGERPDDRPGNPANPTEFSSWPNIPAGSRPRSSTLVITKDDGGPIGS